LAAFSAALAVIGLDGKLACCAAEARAEIAAAAPSSAAQARFGNDLVMACSLFQLRAAARAA
jgi:hypothetical protein